MPSRYSKRVFSILELTDPSDKTARCVSVFINALIFLNVIAVIVETSPTVSQGYSKVFYLFEVFSVVVFSLEYLLRLLTCTASSAYSHPVWGRIRFAISPMAIVDLLAVLPFYLPLVFAFDLRVLRALRLLRLFRVLKLGRYSDSFRVLGAVVRNKREELLICAFTVLILLVVASSLMYHVERDVQPDVFSSIPAAMWWAVATLTTVGYGDVYPVTALGKIMASMIAFLGVGMFALPAGILASGFAEAISKRRKTTTCPHCGRVLD